MKLHPDDPRLTAYLLGELSANEAATVERTAAVDPAIQSALRDLKGVQRILGNTLAPTSASNTLLPHQREVVLRKAREADQARIVAPLAPRPRSRKSWLVPLSAAALVTLAVFVLVRSHTPDDGTLGTHPPADPNQDWDHIPLEIALLPAPGPADVSRHPGGNKPAAGSTALVADTLARQAAARDAALAKTGDEFLSQVAERLRVSPLPAATAFPALSLRSSVPAITTPALPLPIQAGRASLSWVTQTIRNQHKLPSHNAVRLEEILNSVTLRPTGSAAIFQGVSIATESLPCPWKPSATLLLVSIRGAADSAREVTATFHADPATVALYRLLGFAPVCGLEPGTLPSRLPAKAITSLALEIEPSDSATTLGSIEWTIDGKPAASIPVTRHPDAEPSDDARFASLLCTYAQWLVHDQPGLIDASLLSALARETASATLPADRADILTLIGQSLELDK